MKKISNVVILASMSMIGQQVQANETLDIDTSKVSKETCEAIKAKLNNTSVKCAVSAISSDFAKTVTIDGKSNLIDIKALQLVRIGDSQNVTSFANSNFASTYNNCHSACHGSRGWR